MQSRHANPGLMDYDDLVDQFIVNESQEGGASETQENSPKSSQTNNNSIPETSDLIKIHVKSMIQSRQIARQTVQLKEVKERNQKFTDLWAKLGVTVDTNNNNNNNVMVGSTSSSVKRNKILKMNNLTTDISKDCSGSCTNELIPCRLELESDGYKLSDVLLLPATPPPTTTILDAISSQLCQDYDLPLDLFQGAISKCLKDQVEEWDVFQGALEGSKIPFEELGPVPIRIDIIVGLYRLEDRLELSLDPKEGNCENMKKLVDGMSSPDERILKETDFLPFKPLILHNLLEQLILWRKGIVFGGFHRDLRSNNLKFHDGDVAVLLNDPPNKSGALMTSMRRHFADSNSFTPILSVLSVEELDKIQGSRERESRRKRKTTTVSASSTAASTGITYGKRSSNSNSASTQPAISNNLTGTVRSPPRTLPTPISYRGSLHRIQNNNGNSDDDEVVGVSGSSSVGAGGQRKRGRRKRSGK